MRKLVSGGEDKVRYVILGLMECMNSAKDFSIVYSNNLAHLYIYV